MRRRRVGAPWRLLPAVAAATALALPAGAAADTATFGSSLSLPARVDTASGLPYTGYDPVANVHVFHDGADTALWNTSLANGSPAAPSDGQILAVKVEGCAQPAQRGPAPLTQIHFQALTPAGAGATIDVTTQPFDMPICGAGGAGPTTVTTYQPTNFCVHRGDFVDFNDEGGFDPSFYPSGVGYLVMADDPQAAMNSFIGLNKTNNGDTMSGGATDRNGFATAKQELLLQAVEGAGPDATPLCPGGTKGMPAGGGGGGSGGGGGGSGGGGGGSGGGGSGGGGGGSGGSGGASLAIPSQSDGVNRKRVVSVAVGCRQAGGCQGTVTLSAGGPVGAHAFRIGHGTGKVRIRVARSFLRKLRRQGRTAVTMSVQGRDGSSVTRQITLH